VAGISVYGASSERPPRYAGRSERFFQEFALVDVAGAWAKVATRVQVLHGEYDLGPYTSRAAHERIAAIVNYPVSTIAGPDTRHSKQVKTGVVKAKTRAFLAITSLPSCAVANEINEERTPALEPQRLKGAH
jgi:pimeloyl-ACP methyl ester carboxylesterase